MACTKYRVYARLLFDDPAQMVDPKWQDHSLHCRSCARDLQRVMEIQKSEREVSQYFANLKMDLEAKGPFFPEVRRRHIAEQLGVDFAFPPHRKSALELLQTLFLSLKWRYGVAASFSFVVVSLVMFRFIEKPHDLTNKTMENIETKSTAVATHSPQQVAPHRKVPYLPPKEKPTLKPVLHSIADDTGREEPNLDPNKESVIVAAQKKAKNESVTKTDPTSDRGLSMLEFDPDTERSKKEEKVQSDLMPSSSPTQKAKAAEKSLLWQRRAGETDRVYADRLWHILDDKLYPHRKDVYQSLKQVLQKLNDKEGLIKLEKAFPPK